MRFSSPLLAALAALATFACGTSRGGGGDDDFLESELLSGLDEAAIIGEAELDEAFPLPEPIEPPEDEAPSDPTLSDTLETRFAAYTPTRDAAGLFTVTTEGEVPADVVATATRGVLFGLDAFEGQLPGFDLFGAIAARPFTVHIFTQGHPTLGFRASVQSCVDKATDPSACVPRVRIPHEVNGGVGKPVRAATFVHELSHLGHIYYTLSPGFAQAGGIPLSSFRFDDFRWQREGSAQFLTARSPDSAAYARLGASECAFEGVARGAFAWRDFDPAGGEATLPYQLAFLIDQVSWHHFKGEVDWLLRWWVARPDGRNAARPETAARSLMRLLSPSASATDLSTLNALIIRAGVDLYIRGRDPWTTRGLTADCFGGGTAITDAAAGSATLSVPSVGFRAATIGIAPGALDTLGSLQLSLSADRASVRAAVYAVALADYLACVAAIPTSALSDPSPRKDCNSRHVVPLGVLDDKHAFKTTLTLTSSMKTALASKSLVAIAFNPYVAGGPRTASTVTVTAGPASASSLTVTCRNSSSEDHVHFELAGAGSVTAYAGAPATLTAPSVRAGDELVFTVSKPSDFGPVSAGSATCKVSDAPSNPTVTYSGSVSCSGF